MARSLIKVALGLVCVAWLTGCGVFGDRETPGPRHDPAPGRGTPHDGAGPAPLPVVSGTGR